MREFECVWVFDKSNGQLQPSLNVFTKTLRNKAKYVNGYPKLNMKKKTNDEHDINQSIHHT